MNILYEGLFIPNSNGIIEKHIENCRNFGTTKLLKTARTYHVTTEYRPNNLHPEFYGTPVTVTVNGYIYDDKVKNPLNEQLSSVEGFCVSGFYTNNDELNNYLEQIDKKYHITISYSNKAVDTNYADFDKKFGYTFELEMVFGGFDMNSNEIVNYIQ